MSDLPPGWNWASVGSVAESLIDGPFGSNLKTEHYQSSGVRVIRLQNIADGHFNNTVKAYISEDHAGSLSRHDARTGDVLIAAMGEILPRVCLVPPDVDRAIVKADCFRLRPREGVLAQYLAYMLSAPQLREEAATKIAGVGRPRLNLKKVSELTIPIPPEKDQAQIVSAIEEHFSRLDVGIRSIRSAQHRTAQMHGAVLEAAIRGQIASAAGTWPLISVNSIAEVVGGITKSPKRAPSVNSFPFLRVANVLRSRLDLREVHQIELFPGDLERYKLRRGDLLIVEGNGSPDQIGRSALWNGSIDPCVHQNHLIRVRPREGVVPEYLNIFWNSPSTRSKIRAAASSTSGLHTLSTGKVRRVEVALPPLKQQQLIVEEVERQLSAIDDLNRTLDAIDARSSYLRRGILAAAFSGALI